jgi:Trypsin-like peptidase domain
LRVGRLLMILRRVISILATGSFFMSVTSIVRAQDLSKTILPITDFKLKVKKRAFPSSAGWSGLVPKIAPALEIDFATGFCLDPECRLIGTNYHVAAVARPRKIKGDEVIQRYLATGPDDDGATTNEILSDRPMKYRLNRDLAIFELRHPLPHYHGLPFSLDDLELDEPVDIYGFPKQSVSPARSLLQFRGVFKGVTNAGFLAFEYNFADGEPLRGGASGGLVIDSKSQQVVGVLSRAGLGANGKPVALAVPIKSLAEFLGKVQPWLAQKIFPSATGANISPALADLFPKFVPLPSNMSLRHRSEEPQEVQILRKRAQLLADSMRNFVAVQTFAWGTGDQPPVVQAEFEVKVLDGFQRFREYPDGVKDLSNVPFPAVNTVVVPGGEWSELPQMVGTALRLKIHQAADTILNGRQIKVFQYFADSEDGVCVFKSVRDFGFFETGKIVTVPCYGEVWTDSDLNILRISQHLELSGKWKDYESVVTYGWLRRAEEASRIIPVTISAQAEYGKKVHWCRGLFTNYRIFDARARIIATDYAQTLPH